MSSSRTPRSSSSRSRERASSAACGGRLASGRGSARRGRGRSARAEGAPVEGTRRGRTMRRRMDGRPRPGRERRRASTEGSSTGSGSRSRSRGRRGGGSHGREAATTTVAVKEATESSQREDGAMAEGMTLEEQGAIGKTFLEGLVGAFGLTATVEVRPLDEETVELAVDGEDLGILVGPRGTTLAALQEVTRTAVQSQVPVADRPDPGRRRSIPGAPCQGADRVHRDRSRPRSWRRARSAGSSRCRLQTARSSTTPRQTSKASPRGPRARTPTASW